MKLSWTSVRARMIELAIGVLLLHMIVSGLELRKEHQRDLLPPQAWFEVFSLYVPDHPQGANPVLLYDRTIRESFTGLWVVEVQRREPNGSFSNECSGSGVSEYEPRDVLPDNGVTWEWFLGRKCAVEPGTYRLMAVYDMRKDGYPMKRYKATSNVFEVIP